MYDYNAEYVQQIYMRIQNKCPHQCFKKSFVNMVIQCPSPTQFMALESILTFTRASEQGYPFYIVYKTMHFKGVLSYNPFKCYHICKVCFSNRKIKEDELSNIMNPVVRCKQRGWKHWNLKFNVNLMWK